MKAQSIRIYYYTHENYAGKCGLWFAAATKQQFKDIFKQFGIEPSKVFRFEVKENGEYVQKDLQKLLNIFGGEAHEHKN